MLMNFLASRGVFTRGGVLFFMILFNALLALAELTSTFATRPIIIKHKNLYAAGLSPSPVRFAHSN
jgi:ABC-type multidrug transport system permease subunit